jgi:hypothetical protein
MDKPAIQFPVTCPRCGGEELGEFPVPEVAAALLAPTSTLRLYAALASQTNMGKSSLRDQEVRGLPHPACGATDPALSPGR